MTENTSDKNISSLKKSRSFSVFESGLGPPTSEEIEERTLYAKEIQAFAQRLVDDPVVNSALQRVGIGGELSAAEVDDINARFELDRHFLVNKQVIYYSIDQQAVILSLARRIVAGEFSDAWSAEGFTYVFDRVFAFKGNVKWQNRIKDVRVPFDVFYQILLEFADWDRKNDAFKKLQQEKGRRVAEFDAAGEPFNEDDLNIEVFEPAGHENRRLFRKYGWICNESVWGSYNGVRNGSYSIDNKEKIKPKGMSGLSD